jgi:hypothetical protein
MSGAIADNVTISGGALVALVVLGIVELGLAIYCIVDIVRRPAVAGGHKWVWIVIVALFNLIGSIIYLAVGRAQPEASEVRADPEPEAAARGKAASAADLLYGPPAETPEAPDPPDAPEPPTAPADS